jgi:hypothetical protein
VQNINKYNNKQAPGLDIHEMGGYGWVKTQKHRYLTNGTSCTLQKRICYRWRLYDQHRQSKPIYIIYGITARAATYAVNELKKGNF